MKSPPKKRAKLHSASQGPKTKASREKTNEKKEVFAEPSTLNMVLPSDDVTLRVQETETLIIKLPEEV
jgi:hypothetical protein